MTDTRSIVRSFVIGWLIMAAIALVFVVLTEQFELHASINRHHAPWADVFFRFYTHAGDGLVPTVLALLLLLVKDVRSFMMMGLSCGLSAIAVQVLKRTVFADHHRPGMFRDVLVDMDWVPGIEQMNHFSFPSGHATCAFSMCLAAAVVIGKRHWALPMLVIAVMLAFSRVYLSQHFTEDVLAGSALGTLTAVGVHHWLYRSSFAAKPWLAKRAFR
ncbi:MAG: phosphatase PAP2 family protein [Flavobacteriales bacterium]|nr:phosphatase PAP2 family protein [Flavobacteriales bacterium]